MEPVWRGISEGSTGFAQAAQAMFAGGRPGSALAEGVAGLSGRREPAEQSAGMRAQLPCLQLPGAAGLRSCILLPLRVWRSWIGEQGTGGGREGSSVAAGSRRVIAGVSGSLRSLGALRAAVAEARSARAGLLAVLA